MEEQEPITGKKRLRWVVLLMVAVGGFYIFINSAMEGGVYYLTVDQAMAQPPTSKRAIRIKGNVVKGSYANLDGKSSHKFAIESGTASTIAVAFAGALPDMFKEGSEVIVTGTRDSTGTLVATELSAKCPSKYEGGISEQARERMGNK
ncbi:MAG: cytochrome c maturation protein CcmE [Bradymonadia bacterium]